MKRLTMRKIKESMRLYANGLSMRKIASSLGVGHSTATDYMKRIRLAGLTWPLPTDMTDGALEALLFHPSGGPSRLVEVQPDWPAIHRELRRPGVTLSLLWEEYRGAHPEGYGYSRFCNLYRRWAGRLTPVMRQHHVAGERVFVDYAGTTLPVIEGTTGKVRQAQLFVAALGALSLTYAEASWSQSLSDWIGAHCSAFTFFGGVPAQVICDNLKSGVTKARRVAPVDDLRPWQRDGISPGTGPLPENRHLVLRPACSLAARLEREHQRSSAPVLSQRH